MLILTREFKLMNEFIFNLMMDHCLEKLLKKDKKSTV